MHEQSHPMAGRTVVLDGAVDPMGEVITGREYVIEDYWDRIGGTSWMTAHGNPACMKYGMRSAMAELPIDDEVVYGKIGSFGHLVHVSELGGPQ